MAAIARKYNPGFLTDDELVASFCVRTREFTSIVEMLRECTGSSNPHQIVIGPRGSGKTSLLLRVAAEIRRDVALSAHFFPIVFAEESYEVATTGEFWLECLSRLAAQSPHRDGALDLERTIEDMRTDRDDRTLAGRCLARLLDFADREGKRLVLMVENLNMMFRDMVDPETGWRLRHTLQTEPRIVMLASATSRFDEIDSPEHALYQQFRVLPLPPLDTNECAVLWETVSGRCPVPETIRSLEILTGGSPRLLTIVARFGAGLSFRELMADLLNLVDDHTEYFKSHIESLPPQERRVYLALADLWKPATTKEIANRSRLETSKCSAQLGRLIERGVVQVKGGTARRKQYYLTERLYNIYYLMRRHRADLLVEALIRFMESYYSPSELKDIGAGIIREAESFSAEMRAFHQVALTRLMESPALAGHREDLLAMITQDSARILGHGTVSPDTVRRAPVRVAPDEDKAYQPRDSASDESENIEVANRAFEEATRLRDQNRLGEALAAFDDILHRFGESETPNLLRLVAKTLLSKGATLGGLSRAEEALASFDDVVRRFGANSSSALIEQVVQALVNKGVALSELNRSEEALDTFDEVWHRFGDSQTTTLFEPLAVAHFYSGLTLAGLNRPKEALAAFDEVVRRFGESDAPAVLDLVSTALVNKGAALNALDRPKDALSAFDEVLRRYEGQEGPAFVESVAHALFSKAATYDDLNQPEEALVVYDEVLRRFGDGEEPMVPGLVAQSWINKGVMLDKLDRPEDALSAFDEVLRRYGRQETPALVEFVAQALVKKGFVLVRLNRPGDALSAYDEAVQRFSGSDTPAALFVQVAEALVGKGAALGELGQAEKALEVFEEVVRRYDGNETPSAIEPVATALVNKGTALVRLNRPQDALVVYEEVVGRFGNSDALAVLELVAKALVNKGAMLGELHRAEEALKVCDEVVHRFGQSDAPAILDPVAMALMNKGTALEGLNRPEEALAVYDEIVHRFGESDSPELYAMAELAHLQKAGVELRHQRYETAIKAVDQVLGERCTESLENRLRGHLIRAKATLATGNKAKSELDIKAVLTVLPRIESLSKAIVDALIASSVELGPARMCDLIQASPSASLLLPLTTALQQELGLEPRVAREVEEIAQDIRQDLAKLREDRTQTSSRETLASTTSVQTDPKDG